jgi:hypothetical protein
MKKGFVLLLILGIFLPAMSESQAPPLPFHTVEGNSGVFITPTAYLANPPEEGRMFGKPSFSTSAAFLRDKDFQSFAITENIWGKFEIGYALERIGLGDWPDDVKKIVPTFDVSEVFLHNLNLRYMFMPEGGLDCEWMPAITFGTHFKWTDGFNKVDEQLSGLCDTIGCDHHWGTEFTLVASKTVTNLLPNPMIITAGLRNGDAVHTGLLGFAGERATTFEGSIIYFLTEKLLFAAEYRQKPDFSDEYSAGGMALVKEENDWWDLCLGYVVNDNVTIAAGYANFGNLLNHKEDSVFAFQVKYEF